MRRGTSRGSPPQQQLPSDSPPQQELSPDSSPQQQQRTSPSYFPQQAGAWGLSPNAAIFIPQTLQDSQQQQYVTPDFYQQQDLYYGWQPQQALHSQQRTSPSSFLQQDEAWGLSSNASSFYSQTLQSSQQQQHVTPDLYQQQEEEYCQDTAQNIPPSLYQSNQEAWLLRETSSQRNFMRQRYNVVPQSVQQQQGAWGQPQQYQQSRNPPQQQRVSQNFSQQLQVTGSLPRYRQLQISQDPQQLQSTSRRQVPQDLSQHQQQIAWGQPQQQQRGTWNQRMRNQSQHQRIPHDSPQQQQGIWHQSSGSPPQQQLVSDSPPQQELSPDSSPQQQQRTSPSSFPQQNEAWGLSPNASIFIPQTLQGSQQQQYVTHVDLYQQQEGLYYRRQSQQVLHNSRQRQLSGQHQQVQDLLQQQTTWTPQYQQQQEALTEIDDADKQTQAVEQNNDRGTENNNMQQQVSQLTLKQTSPKAKMTSSAMKQYQSSIPRRQELCRNDSKSQNHTYVLTNMFEIIFHENFITNVIHYDIDITPIASKTLYRKVFEKYRLTYFKNRYPAFDGKKNAYSANVLPCDNHETDIKIEDKLCHIQCNKQCEEHKIVKTFKIALKKVGDINLSWMKNLPLDFKDLKDPKDPKDDLIYQTGIQALDIIIHGYESGLTNVGRSWFWNLNNGPSLTKGLCSSWGGFLSAIRGQKMYLNVDVVHKGFVIPQNVIDLIANVANENEQKNNRQNTSRDQEDVIKIPEKINSNDDKEINKILKGLRVIYEMPLNCSDDPSQRYRRRIYRLKGTGPSADECTFKYNESKITVTNYFKNEKNYTLKHPKLPCLSVGSKEKEIYLPAELCTIVEGQSVKKLNDEQTTRMIKQAATKPDERRNKIIEAFKNINVNESPIMKQEFHLSVSEQMKIVNAKILDPPKLRYKNEKLASVSDGVWRMQNLEFKKAGISLEKDTWTILSLTKLNNMYSELHKFMKNLIQYARDLGMEIKDAKTDQFKNFKNKNDIQSYFAKNKSLKLIIVIIPNCLKSQDFTADIYSEIKQMAELKLGVLTQCIKCQNFIRANSGSQFATRSIITNILLKINAKLNGINYTLHKPPKCLENNFMLVGADVTHPSPDADTPSIAAVTASIDTFGFQYNVMYKLQEPREEMISDLEDIITSQLETYKIKTKKVPMRLIYYRDGVSEGQLKKVKEIEITAIKRACAKFSSNIQITCLVVQKRHHVRFFPGEREGEGYKNSDKNGNVKAGTIVDTEITHPEDIEFYLVSHASIQGTARPTKYRCIRNDSNLSKDEIEDMTYYLCHMYVRCTRAVSYPAPTYYAHLAAYRGKALIENHKIKITSEETSRAVLSKAQADLDNISIKHRSLMYFV